MSTTQVTYHAKGVNFTEMYESGELHEALGVDTPAPGDNTGMSDPAASAPMGIENRLG